jgi:hypothetical protein
MSTMRLKIGIVTLLSCFALLLGLFGSTGIASAHTTSAQAPAVNYIGVFGTHLIGGDCVRTNVVGKGFDSGTVHLFARGRFGHPVSVSPASFWQGGSFERTVTACGGIAPIVLTAVGPLGHPSNPVYLP